MVAAILDSGPVGRPPDPDGDRLLSECARHLRIHLDIAVRNEDYERAATLRDRIAEVTSFREGSSRRSD